MFVLQLIGIRLQNVYDVNAKTFLFKFAKPDDKELVLVESGTRIHTTQFSREKSITPTPFCAKIRKHLRTRRLTNVRQLGVDRIVDFEFAGGEKSIGYHIICEFYASGNIILTDHEYRILALLRAVQPTETLKMAVGEIYNIQSVLNDFQKVEAEQLRNALSAAGPKDNLKKILNIKFEYGPAMIEHIILESELDPNMKVASDFDTSENSPMMQALLEGFKKADDMIESTGNSVPKGYIILQNDTRQTKNEKEEEEMEIYDEFHPHLYKQFSNRKFKEFSTFDKAVDEFFSSIEAQKLELKTRRQEEAALKKLEAVKLEQEKRVESLLNQQLTNTRKAQLIELNLQFVDAAITIIRNAVASQMDWQDLNDLVKEEKRRGNPIALIIDTLKLETNQVTLLLTDPEEHEESENDDDDDDDDDDEEEEEEEKEEKPKETFKIDVDIELTAFANARKYYEQKKTTASKHEKTIEASTKALKSAERKIRKDLKETKITATINKIRKPFWFEKFQWFISTEGYLVIAGRDMQQNEMLVRRYLSKDDIYVHADLHGAASVIVKNKPQANGQPISPSTLYQAGIMSVCQSKAWDSKIVTSAYWVYPDQVSKSAPSGEYLTTGSFMIRGKKNFLPPVQLVYGFGYLFKLDESSIGNHVKNHIQNTNDAAEDAADNDDSSESDQFAEKMNTEAVDQADRHIESTEEDKKIDSITAQESTTPVNEKSQTEEDDTSDDDDDDSSSSSSSEDEGTFPDTKLQSLPVTNHESMPNADKYALDEYGNDSDDQYPGTPDSDSKGQARRKFITAKERRLMKKENVTEITDEIRQKQKQKQQNNNSKPKQQAPAKPKVVTPPSSTRGRKGKAKKIKEKYADQDEDERQLRMELLGSNKGPQPKGKKAKREAKAKIEKEVLERQRAEAKKAAEQQAQLAKADEDKENAELLDVGADEKDTEAIRQMLKEENITMLEADEIANLSILDSLTGTPLPEDIIHFAIPVCAPYPAIQKYKYKVKLTPGSLKRGKAVKQAESVFFHLPDATPREKELIKGVPDMESINTMMSKVKVSAPNLEASKRKKGSGRK
ncbi:hypothetical protein G6F22_003417 [Rhizopus arrhizus]|nr:hypothetical protein G6F22_003417 [Rhizopus arrhizus]